MSKRMNFFLAHIASCLASLATLVAISNANSTCLFMSYQPDIPEELK